MFTSYRSLHLESQSPGSMLTLSSPNVTGKVSVTLTVDANGWKM